MKNPKHILFFVTLAMFFFIAGCNERFSADIFDPRLPEYSESGRNHAGAYINGEPWRSYPRVSVLSSNDDPYFRFDSVSDAYELIFPQGNLINESGNSGAVIDLRFVLSAESVAPIIDGTAEYPLVIQLDGEEAHAKLRRPGTISHPDSTENCSSTLGLIHIRHVSANELEDGATYVLMAGTFGFDIEDACGRYEVRSGRFDFTFRCFWNSCI